MSDFVFEGGIKNKIKIVNIQAYIETPIRIVE
jgi:hypothetical protein